MESADAPLKKSMCDTGTPRIRRPVGVLLSRFPLITETFILREIDELERQGQPVVLIPMILEHPEVVHEEARRWLDRVVGVPFISSKVLRSFLAAWIRKPAPMFRLLFWMTGKALFRPGVLFRSLALFPKSVHLASLVTGRDIRHLHAHFATHPTTMAFIIATLTDVSFSFTVHAHDIFVDRTLLREKIRKASFIRSISRFNKTFLENLFPRASAGKIHVVHVGIEPERYRGAESKAQSLGAEPRILCIAAMKPYKGVGFLIEAAGILRAENVDFRLEIIGTGPLMNEMAHAVKQRELDDRVILLGALPQHEVTEKIREADLFVLPSVIAADGQMEGIPVALMEAMAAGKPVVATSISGIPELVEHETSGLLVDPANSRQLANALRRLIADPELRRRLSEKGREKVVAEFDLRDVVSRLIPKLDSVNPPVDEIRSVPDVGRSVSWGLRRGLGRHDSHVFEAMAGDGSGVEEIILKRHVTRPGESRPAEARFLHELRVLQDLARHFEPIQEDDFRPGVPKVIGSHAASVTLAMERAGEQTVEDSIRSARRREPGAVNALGKQMEAVGRWLAHFQTFETADGNAALEHQIREARDLLGRVGRRSLSRRQQWRLEERIDSLDTQLTKTGRVAVSHHGDFWPGNVFFSGDAVRVIDFEGYGFALPSRDVVWFLLHTGLYLAFRAPRMYEMSRSRFLEGYRHAIDPGELELSRITAALQMLDKDDTALSWLQRRARMSFLRRELMR
ncbi:MAG: glycosyltransferase [Acidobacteria bacterium]|nr:glycosyltransferase [Acidobacteriota bacterium]